MAFTFYLISVICTNINHEYVLIAEEFKQYFLHESTRGEESKLLNTHAKINPKGTKKLDHVKHKELVCVDIGGTTLKIGIAEIKDGKITLHDRVDTSFIGLGDEEHSKTIYEFIESKLSSYLANDRGHIKEGVLTFSFPVKAISAKKSRVLGYTKEFPFKKVEREDEDPIVELNNACEKIGIVFEAIVNDSTATLLATFFSDRATSIAIIIGTGVNGALFIEEEKGYLTAVNTEWGGFCGESIKRLYDDIDIQNDKLSMKPGEYLSEKLTGGAYFMNYLISKFKRRFPEYKYLHETLTVEQVNNPHLIPIDNEKVEEEVKQIIQEALKRKFSVLAALIVGLFDVIKDERGIKNHIIGINGSGISKDIDQRRLKDAINMVLNSYYGENHDITHSFKFVDDASLIGAVVMGEECLMN